MESQVQEFGQHSEVPWSHPESKIRDQSKELKLIDNNANKTGLS